MGEMSSEGANLGAGIDLSQFYQVFFEEAGENLDRMEQQLLEINIEAADDEELNSIFRCAHSVKGGAATFGFADVAELTHQMETLLDKLRRHELTPTAPMVDVLLQAGDALRAQLARHQGAGGDVIDTFNEITDLGTIEAIDGGQPSDGMRRFRVITTSSDNDLLDLFTFHVSRDEVALLPMGPGYGFHEGSPGAPEPEPADLGYGFFDNAPGAPASEAATASVTAAVEAVAVAADA